MNLPEIYLQAISDYELKNAFLLDALTNIKYIILFSTTKKDCYYTNPCPLKFNTSFYYVTTDPLDTAVTYFISLEKYLKYLVLLQHIRDTV